MDNQRKKIEEWEREKNMLLKLDEDMSPTEMVTHADFLSLVDSLGFIGCQWTPRLQWLQANGHSLTRANMVDHTLKSKQPEPVAEPQVEQQSQDADNSPADHA